MIVCWVAFLWLSNVVGNELETEVLSFEPPNPYVSANVSRLDSYTSLTFCAWARAQKDHFMLSYYRSGEAEKYWDSLTLEVDFTGNQNLTRFVPNDAAHFLGPYSYADGHDWFHYCGTWDGTRVAVYFNGETLEEADINQPSLNNIIDEGTLILGNYLNGVNIPADAYAFYGSMYQVNMWSSVLTADEISVYASCNETDVEGDVIAWSTLKCSDKIKLSDGVSFDAVQGPCPNPVKFKMKDCDLLNQMNYKTSNRSILIPRPSTVSPINQQNISSDNMEKERLMKMTNATSANESVSSNETTVTKTVQKEISAKEPIKKASVFTSHPKRNLTASIASNRTDFYRTFKKTSLTTTTKRPRRVLRACQGKNEIARLIEFIKGNCCPYRLDWFGRLNCIPYKIQQRRHDLKIKTDLHNIRVKW